MSPGLACSTMKKTPADRGSTVGTKKEGAAPSIIDPLSFPENHTILNVYIHLQIKSMDACSSELATQKSCSLIRKGTCKLEKRSSK